MKRDKILAAYLNIINESAEARLIPSDADFKQEMENAIAAKELVSFTYTKKDGSSYTMEAIPYKMMTSAGRDAVLVYQDGDVTKTKMLYIDSMGIPKQSAAATSAKKDDGLVFSSMTEEMKSLLPGLSQLLEENPEFTTPNPYFEVGSIAAFKPLLVKFRMPWMFFKPIGYDPETKKVVLACLPYKEKSSVSTSEDGDSDGYDDGDFQQLRDTAIYRYPKDEPIGYMWGELKADNRPHIGTAPKNAICVDLDAVIYQIDGKATLDKLRKPYAWFEGKRKRTSHRSNPWNWRPGGRR